MSLYVYGARLVNSDAAWITSINSGSTPPCLGVIEMAGNRRNSCHQGLIARCSVAREPLLLIVADIMTIRGYRRRIIDWLHSFGFDFVRFAAACGNDSYWRQAENSRVLFWRSLVGRWLLVCSSETQFSSLPFSCSFVLTVRWNCALVMRCLLLELRNRLRASCTATMSHYQGGHGGIHHFGTLLRWQRPTLRTLTRRTCHTLAKREQVQARLCVHERYWRSRTRC